VIVADSSVLYALLDDHDQGHTEASSWYEGALDELLTTPLVLAEVDHLAARRLGLREVRAFRSDIVAGAYAIEWWEGAAAASAEIANRYGDLGLSLTDASLVALAARLETTSIATFDERHFRAVRPLSGDAFTLLPRDAALA
jgi:hypothetical protein